ncbi:FecCD family ABC transporter permease [Alicyclobacillus macrosporangiidus]|uniref:Iron complex transport system permease protein n=1 Tax=Alicyclobacillus macrosporangiidus TaxID=392015 RepID=A0A1I7JHE1_9BACL|nr:iron ABC transporter permease [Alicyclobacillus macrosporangiidus]SFU84609.1 iron complex transport system permease protein [Alicyclobacillus macrosporangiidus]
MKHGNPPSARTHIRPAYRWHRFTVVTAVLVLMMILLFIVSLSVGETFLDPLELTQTLFGSTTPYNQLMLNLRAPRILAALLAGCALGGAGAILQAIIRNPLASPDLLGISGGSSAAIVGLLLLFPNVSVHWHPPAALLGALVAAILIYGLAWRKGLSPTRLVLVGIAIGAMAAALTTFLLVASAPEVQSRAYVWLVGSVYGSDWPDVAAGLPWVLGFGLASWLFAQHIHILQFSDDVSAALGARLTPYRVIGFALCVGLTGGALALGGAIGFVGLLAPHIARMLVGTEFGKWFVTSALLGGIIVMVADTVGRTAFSPLDVPVGIFTSAVGAPFFIFLLLRGKRIEGRSGEHAAR